MLGISHVQVVDPYDLAATEAALRDAVAARACGGHFPARMRPAARGAPALRPRMVVAERCTACGVCLRLGCPALSKSAELFAKTGRPKAQIDPLLCAGCGICAQNCTQGAIVPRVAEDAEAEGGH